ncbi:multinuclear nonheme iron-dependent oxidase [Williamsia soli]|uniref:multinuclear nonheme iron-dependent oxidase n=1 Tax=Williamsia soli TaxID=364929 RepID=UPI001A9D16D0|nr:DUF692 family multinuclear iron-containing protein [Williamsia soli]
MRAQVSGSTIAWRPAISEMLVGLADAGSLTFTEVVAENMTPGRLPSGVEELRTRGVVVIPHGVGLGLAGADLPDPERLTHLARLARELESPLVSEHIAFVRAAESPDVMHGDVLEAGHLLPPPRTGQALDVLCDNISRAQDVLGVPLALENVAALIGWPEDEFDEPDYLTEIVRRTGVRLVLDVANLYASAVARGSDPVADLCRFPLAHAAYVHTAGGRFREGMYIDTHGDPMIDDVGSMLTAFVAHCREGGLPLPGIMLERDSDVTSAAVAADLEVIDQIIGAATSRGQEESRDLEPST